MKTSEIREIFLSYFENQDHLRLSSSTLIPENDPTLFFVNAGMVQFKDIFTGNEKRKSPSATTAQKCLRVSGKHNDLENVGQTPRHHTFFEMLGNFSFGDYFKADAIKHSWTLLTEKLKIDPDRLWITVFESDDEAYQLWQDIAGVRPERIQRLGEKDNFWSMGDTGPCGPCSEIHYDHGPEYGDDPNGPAGETDRYVEIWNLVFMQYDRASDGTLTLLPSPSIDTGMGLERVAAIKQGVYSNYDTDAFQGIIQSMAKRASVHYGKDKDADVSLKVIADHSRACTFLIADGVMPSNEGRGYVLRRIARRAIRYGVRLGLNDNFMGLASKEVIQNLGHTYPEIVERQDFILEVIEREEIRFRETLDKGLIILEEALEKVTEGGRLNGNIVFSLHDTFGFPMDLTELIAGERGIQIDSKQFKVRMEEQRAAGRANWKGSGEAALESIYHQLAEEHNTYFTGYTNIQGTGIVKAILNSNGEKCQSLDSTGTIIVSQSPFYAESGGQVGDIGEVKTRSGKGLVSDVQKPVGQVFHHHIKVTEGQINLGEEIQLNVNSQHRKDTRRNHTATHLLHAALRNVLGEHVTQKGSLVEPKRLRFDFSHHKPVSQEELSSIQQQVQTEVQSNSCLQVEVCSMDEAKEKGAMALFGEKYGDEVRVVKVGDFSTELCGGIHVPYTGEIGTFLITNESSVSAGIRRIEAITGNVSIQRFQNNETILKSAQHILKAQPDQLLNQLQNLLEEKRNLSNEVKKLSTEIARLAAGDLLSEAVEINGIKVIAAEFTGSVDAMREEADKLRSQLGTAVVVLGSKMNGVKLIAAVTKDIAGKRAHAGKIIKSIAPMIGGGGGGRPDMAQAGGKNPDGLDAALAKVKELIAE